MEAKGSDTVLAGMRGQGTWAIEAAMTAGGGRLDRSDISELAVPDCRI